MIKIVFLYIIHCMCIISTVHVPRIIHRKQFILKETKRVSLPEDIVGTAQQVKFGSFLVNYKIMTGPENPDVAVIRFSENTIQVLSKVCAVLMLES